jgi:4-hydroxybenzoate polyprenyltransferase
MLVNRLADARFDRDNPRTAKRAVAAGRLSLRDGWVIALASAVCFVIVCCGFWLALGNVWPIVLSLPVLGWIALYSFTKRFTASAHFFLGSALAISPMCAALAVWPGVFGLEGGAITLATGDGAGWTDAGTSLVLLAGFVGLWVAGFDIAYALQDLAFDRDRGLRSVPAMLGQRGSLWASRATHLAAYGLLIWAWQAGPGFGWLFGGAVLAVGGLLVFEHAVLARRGLAGLPMAFFTVNGVVSCVLGAAGVVDVVW